MLLIDLIMSLNKMNFLIQQTKLLAEAHLAKGPTSA
jgi:hypothetical protein